MFFFFFSSRRRHTIWNCDWSSDVCSSDLLEELVEADGALVRDVEDRDGPAPLEEIRGVADLLGERRTATTAHAPSVARATARAPRRGSSPGGSSFRCERPRGCRRDRPGFAPE